MIRKFNENKATVRHAVAETLQRSNIQVQPERQVVPLERKKNKEKEEEEEAVENYCRVLA